MERKRHESSAVHAEEGGTDSADQEGWAVEVGDDAQPGAGERCAEGEEESAQSGLKGDDVREHSLYRPKHIYRVATGPGLTECSGCRALIPVGCRYVQVHVFQAPDWNWCADCAWTMGYTMPKGFRDGHQIEVGPPSLGLKFRRLRDGTKPEKP